MQISTVPSGAIQAFIDESGARGFSRKLTPDQDHEVGLLSALLVPDPCVRQIEGAFRPGYERFVSAAPPNSKIHITDAFASGDANWEAAARSVRSEYCDLINEFDIPVIYAARRLRVERESYERDEALCRNGMASRQSRIRVSNRISRQTIEDSLVTTLALILDGFCEDRGHQRVDLVFDSVDSAVAQLYRAYVDRTRNVSDSRSVVKGWDAETQSGVVGEVRSRFRAPFPLDTRFLGELRVAGKANPLVLAADMVTNLLYRHLINLPADALLCSQASIAGWKLGARVYGVSDDAVWDRI